MLGIESTGSEPPRVTWSRLCRDNRLRLGGDSGHRVLRRLRPDVHDAIGHDCLSVLRRAASELWSEPDCHGCIDGKTANLRNNVLFKDPLFCFFGRRIVDTLDDPTPPSPCPHVLLIATDDFSIFTSETSERKRALDSDDDDDVHLIDRIWNMGSTSN